MSNKEDKMYSSAISPTNTAPQTNQDFLDKDANDYYSMLKSQSYKALLDKQVQAAAAKDNALKYTNNMMQRSGYGSQGVSESTGLGIANSYRNALAGYQNDYNTAINEAYKGALDIRNNARNDVYDAITASIGQEGITQEQLDSSLNNYGITKNADGTYNYDNANLSDIQKKMLNDYLVEQGKVAQEQAVTNTPIASPNIKRTSRSGVNHVAENVGNDFDVQYTDSNGVLKTINLEVDKGDKINYGTKEYNRLVDIIRQQTNSNSAQEGDLVYYNGKLYAYSKKGNFVPVRSRKQRVNDASNGATGMSSFDAFVNEYFRNNN